MKKRTSKPKSESKLPTSVEPKTPRPLDGLSNDGLEKLERDLRAPVFKANKDGQLLPNGDANSAMLSLLEAVGTGSQSFASVMADQLARIKKEPSALSVTAALGFLHAQQPKDEIEAIFLSQMYAAHTMAMEFASRIPYNSDPEVVDRLTNRFGKLSRLCMEQSEALDKRRGKGQQRIEVQHVHVNEGGQAIVGNVQGGGADGKKA